MNVFGLGRAILGMAYVLQLTGGAPGWKAMSMLNHTLTLYVPLVYWIGASVFFGLDTQLWKLLGGLALGYTLAQCWRHC
jgi:hypothetical protein